MRHGSIKTQVLLCVFTFCLVVVGFLQWRTLDETEQIFKIEQRPWISVENIDVVEGTKERDDFPSFVLSYTLKNVGHLPAIVALDAAVISDPSQSKLDQMWWLRQQKICDERKTDISSKHEWIYPGGDKVQFEIFPGKEWPYILPSRMTDSVKGLSDYAPRIIGCIIYQSVEDEILHEAPFFASITIDDGIPTRSHVPNISREANGPRLIVKAISMTGKAD